MKRQKKIVSLFAKWRKGYKAISQQRKWRVFGWLIVCLLPFLANYFLQLSQNNWSFELANKFAFEWHTEKFLLSCFVLATLLLFFISLLGSVVVGSLLFSVGTIVLGTYNSIKMYNRMEPLYPDDITMVTEWGLLWDMIGTPLFIVFLIGVSLVFYLFCRVLWKSLKLSKIKQSLRVVGLLTSVLLLTYISNFNDSNNKLRAAYDKTAAWIPYSQKMNYYNTGFIAGFLYNLKVEPMEKPAGYSEKAMEKLIKKYTKQADEANESIAKEEAPNIIYIMSESFSDPLRLGIRATEDPLKDYRQLANQSYSGKMLSQNYGGGTANIEFEALSSLSMALFNSQMTTPYTMLVPKKDNFPTLVSRLKSQKYETTAIHPYNTSMYKRQDVYNIFGFDTFLDENTMTYQDSIGNNPYISDESAYKEVMQQLESNKNSPQFIHLVTMQTHMPYGKKYPETQIQASGDVNTTGIADYLTDVKYSSEAFKTLLKQIDQLERRTLVVFWGDHLPALYSEEFQATQQAVDLHLTEFMFYDNQHRLKTKTNQQVLSPFYFTSHLMEQAGVVQTPFDVLLNQLSEKLPAFEKSFYYENGKWQSEIELDEEAKKLYKEYQLVQYDVVGGYQYATKTKFFNGK